MYAAIAAVLHESWLGGEVVVLAVFQHKDATLFQQSAATLLLQPAAGDEARQRGQLFQSIGWVGKDQVIRLAAALDEAEHIGPQWYAHRIAHPVQAITDKAVAVAVLLYAHHALAPSGHQLERYAARSGKQVQRRCAFKVHVSRQHIEDVLLGKVGGWPCLEAPWYVEVSALVLSGNDSHLLVSPTSSPPEMIYA